MKRHTSDSGQRLRVDEAFQCSSCDQRWYYTRSCCPNCRGEHVETYTLGEGTVVAATTVEVTPPDIRSPNWLGLTRFEDVQLIAQLTERVSVGDRVGFAGEYRLRSGDEHSNPRLTAVSE